MCTHMTWQGKISSLDEHPGIKTILANTSNYDTSFKPEKEKATPHFSHHLSSPSLSLEHCHGPSIATFRWTER